MQNSYFYARATIFCRSRMRFFWHRIVQIAHLLKKNHPPFFAFWKTITSLETTPRSLSSILFARSFSPIYQPVDHNFFASPKLIRIICSLTFSAEMIYFSTKHTKDRSSFYNFHFFSDLVYFTTANHKNG
jgi:hypothetical protein